MNRRSFFLAALTVPFASTASTTALHPHEATDDITERLSALETETDALWGYIDDLLAEADEAADEEPAHDEISG